MTRRLLLLVWLLLAKQKGYGAEPRFITPRHPDRETIGDRLADVARNLIGQDPMPWQRQVFDLYGEIRTPDECDEAGIPRGSPAYREVAFGVPRQSGKTTVNFAAMFDRCVFWLPWNRQRPRCVYTAQTGKDARDKFIIDMVPMLTPPAIGGTATPSITKRVRNIGKGVGSEKAEFHVGQTGAGGGLIILGNNTEASGHGKTIDLGVIDEAFWDVDHRREQAISGSQATRDQAQRLISSTAGTATSEYWNGKCEAGRAAVVKNTGSGLAYVEFSAPEDADTFDEEMWKLVHPALGYTISLATMRSEAESMDELEFRRAFLNVPTQRVTSQHIPATAWDNVNIESTGKPIGKGQKVWAVGVSRDRSKAAIAVCDIDTGTTKLVKYEDGCGWLASAVNQYRSDLGGVIVYDATGPAGNIGADHPEWVAMSSTEMTQAFGDFYDGCVDQTLRIIRDREVDDALAGAEIKTIGDRKAWSRSRSTRDITPLVVVNIAAVCRPPEPPQREGFVL